MNKIRAFIAVPLSEALLDELATLRHRLESRVPHRSVRWVRPEGIHLTLKFLGDTPVTDVSRIEQALDVVARYAPTFTFTTQGLGCFPNARRPRVIWVGVQEPSGRLAALAAAVEEAMVSLGYKAERRAFHPHLTLGRVRRRTSQRDVAQVGEVVENFEVDQLAQVVVERFELIRSVLKPSGAEYTTWRTFELQAEP